MAKSKTKLKPSLTVTSVFGATQLTMTDTENSVSLVISKAGVEQLIEELQICLDRAEDDETPNS